MNVGIAARKHAEDAVKEAARQKDEFISILAHELRNPLAPLRSGIDLMLNDTATSTAKVRALALMSRQTSHISRLVDDLIDASRITTGNLQLHLEEHRLKDVLRASVETIQPAIVAKRQRVAFRGLDEVDPVLNMDPARLTQAFVNILNNCAKFSPEHSKIDIIVSRHEEQVGIIFRDRGRGIDDEDLPNIFKLFVLSARHDRGDGLGIGMALAKDIVVLHSGTIEARRSSEGPGAEFEIRLPVLSFDAVTSTTEAPAQGASWESLRVLVVDDNVDAGEMLGALLEVAGHTIRIVHSGGDAIKETLSFLPDVIFMDIGMPDMGGLEATRRIRSLELTVRPFVIALTGWNSDEDRNASRDAGCDMHLTKPVAVADLTAAMERTRPRSAPR